MAKCDRFGRELHVGDECIYISNDGCVQLGIVDSFTDKMVRFTKNRQYIFERDPAIVTPISLIIMSKHNLNFERENND